MRILQALALLPGFVLGFAIVAAPGATLAASPGLRPAAGIVQLGHLPHGGGYRPGLRHDGRRTAFGYGGAYLYADPGYWGPYGRDQAQPSVAPEAARPRTVIYNRPGPLTQDDRGYVAQPVIYNVGEVLRAHSTGVRSLGRY